MCWLCGKENGGLCAHCGQPVCLDAEPGREVCKPGCWTAEKKGLSCIECKEKLGLVSEEERALAEQAEDENYDSEISELLVDINTQDKGVNDYLDKMKLEEKK